MIMYAAVGFAFGMATFIDTENFWLSLMMAIIWPVVLSFMIGDYI